MYLFEREFKAAARKKAAKEGASMQDGSFPIYNKKDLKNAIKLAGHSKHGKAAAMAHIRKRANALGLSMNEDVRNKLEAIIEAWVFSKPSVQTDKVPNTGTSTGKLPLVPQDDRQATTDIQTKIGPLAEPVKDSFFKSTLAKPGNSPIRTDRQYKQLIVTAFHRKPNGSVAETNIPVTSHAEAGEHFERLRKLPGYVRTSVTDNQGKHVFSHDANQPIQAIVASLDTSITNLTLRLYEEDFFNKDAVLGLFTTFKPKDPKDLLIKPQQSKPTIFGIMKDLEDRKKKGSGPKPPDPPEGDADVLTNKN